MKFSGNRVFSQIGLQYIVELFFSRFRKYFKPYLVTRLVAFKSTTLIFSKARVAFQMAFLVFLRGLNDWFIVLYYSENIFKNKL